MNNEEKQNLIQRWQELNHELAGADSSREVKLLAVSKYAPDEAVQILIDAGQDCFGESRPQNLRDRAAKWPACAWHMIGPLQKNKAKFVGRHAAMWHSCENLETVQAVAAHVKERVLPVLIQVNIANVQQQHGLRPVDVPEFAKDLAKIEGLKLAGLMCMAAKDGDARQAFRELRNLRDALFGGSFAELCMGMSGDYHIALEEGASMVRLGSTLFGDWDTRRQ
ncbi:MAG: YggS family pyridoxal phosphate-dependent enzyme [Mariprofundus sp.]